MGRRTACAEAHQHRRSIVSATRPGIRLRQDVCDPETVFPGENLTAPGPLQHSYGSIRSTITQVRAPEQDCHPRRRVCASDLLERDDRLSHPTKIQKEDPPFGIRLVKRRSQSKSFFAICQRQI